MKDDVELPAQVPRKRKQIETLLDVHIATWLGGDTISRGDRLRLEEEKERRKQLRLRDAPPVIGLLCDYAGMTPEQRTQVRELVSTMEPEVVLHMGRAKVGNVSFPKRIERDTQVLVKSSTIVIAAPKETIEPNNAPDDSVWSVAKYARHRKVPVQIIMPNGEQKEWST